MGYYQEGPGSGSTFFAFLLGGIIGVGAAMLMAPRSGEETRRKILDLSDDVRKLRDDYVEQVRGRVNETYERGREYVDETKGKIETAIDAGREAYKTAYEKGMSKPHSEDDAPGA